MRPHEFNVLEAMNIATTDHRRGLDGWGATAAQIAEALEELAIEHAMSPRSMGQVLRALGDPLRRPYGPLVEKAGTDHGRTRYRLTAWALKVLCA